MSDKEIAEIMRTLELGALAMRMAEDHIEALERKVKELQALVDALPDGARVN